MYMKQSFALVFFTFIFISFATTAVAFDENNYNNESRLMACDLLQEAKDMFDANPSAKKLSEIEGKLFEALSKVPESVDRLNFVRRESRLIHGAGRWAKYTKVNVDRHCKYDPHKLMNKVRMQIPPEPWVKASLKTSYNKSMLTVRIKNRGKTSLENIEATITSSELPSARPKLIEHIKPGEDGVLQWSTKMNIANTPFKIIFKEQYGFNPCALHF